MAALWQFVLAALGLMTLAQGQNFNNPVLWEDLVDNEVIRVDDTYYYTTPTMHYSPGAPILRSYDLVNWEYLSHAVPTLDWGTKYDLTGGQQAYVKVSSRLRLIIARAIICGLDRLHQVLNNLRLYCPFADGVLVPES